MAVFNEPTQWAHPLGNNADTSTLPDDAAATAGIASLQKLFQIINATPLEAGGIAPGREDVNALFKYLGDSIFYVMNGGVPSYNAAYDYIAGRVVLYNGNLYKCIQANGVSSTVVAPGSDTAYWQKILEDLDLINYANVDLSNLSATGQAKIEGFAEKDLSNITQDGKNTAISWLMPDLTSQIQVSAPYTAPSDGWLYIYLASNSNGGTLKINDVDVFLRDIYDYRARSTDFIPVSKGDVITTEVNRSSFSLYFMRCKGAN